MKTRDLLRMSLSHWEKNLKAARMAAKDGQLLLIRIDSGACALCSAFNNSDTAPEDLCAGCPVYGKTGETGCRGTPWMGVRDLFYSDGFKTVGHDLIKAIEDEVEFLRSLYDEEKTK